MSAPQAISVSVAPAAPTRYPLVSARAVGPGVRLAPLRCAPVRSAASTPGEPLLTLATILHFTGAPGDLTPPLDLGQLV